MTESTLFFAVMVIFVVAVVAFPFALIALVARSERKAQERLRAEGVRCIAFVKTYRRVSMTQHKVLFEIRLPMATIGREYMLSGLSDAWLADVCALGRPVQVVAHPDAATLVFV